MKALVTYYSETGNTKKLAEAVYDGIEQAEKEILSIKDVADVEDYDIVFCGFPVQAHSLPRKMEAFLKKIPEGKKVALFGTHGSLRGGEMAITAFHHALSLVKRVLGTFGCRGKVKSDLIDQLMKKPEHKAWAMEAQSAAGHPDAADLEDAKEFARQMVRKARTT
jgi:flavodoxin